MPKSKKKATTLPFQRAAIANSVRFLPVYSFFKKIKLSALILFWSHMIVIKIFQQHRESKSSYNPTTLEWKTANSTPILITNTHQFDPK